MTLSDFLQKLSHSPTSVEFEETIATIDAAYDFVPVEFANGDLFNKAGQNAGSCKILAFGKLQGLSEDATLACFGRYYREDVLLNPNGADHQNIRNFMASGWQGVSFNSMPLTPKQN